MSDVEAANQASSSMELFLNVIATLIVLAMLGILVFIVKKIIENSQQIENEAATAERMFERREAKAVLLASPAPANPLPPNPAPPQATPPPLTPVQPSHEPVAASAPPQPGLNPLEAAARRLQALGVILHLEGRVPMPIPPDGLIYRLKTGGLCAILPRVEGEATMLHLSRRFDMLVIVTSDGELLTCERFQNRVKDLVGIA